MITAYSCEHIQSYLKTKTNKEFPQFTHFASFNKNLLQFEESHSQLMYPISLNNRNENTIQNDYNKNVLLIPTK